VNLYEHLDAGGKAGLLADRVTELQSFIAQGNTRAAMEALARIAALTPDVAADLVENGVHEGMTQAAMARALGVPAYALRGAKREFAR
jgi:hypothetical protein